MLLVFRLGGIFVVAPVLASVAIPMQARVLLVFAFGAAMYPGLVPELARAAGAGIAGVPVELDVFTLGWAGVFEALVGVVIGLIALLPVTAVQLSGLLMGQQMGFGLAQVYNPALETDSDLFGELLLYLALGAFIAMGGLELLFVALGKSYIAVPVGAMLPGSAPVGLILGTMDAGFGLALRVSLPLMAIIIMETVATSFLMKTMPQMNIMSLGFAVKIVLGLLAIIAGLRAMNTVTGDHVSDVGQMLLRWASGLEAGAKDLGGAR
jgi:flagellar biosynthetic protein FliR